MSVISRRDFLKGIAATGASGLLMSMVPMAASAEEGEKAPEIMNVYKELAKLNTQDYDFRSNTMELTTLFSPWKLGNLEFSHRMVKSAAGSDTMKGVPEELYTYHTNFINGGIEMVWVEDYCNMYGNQFDRPTRPAPETMIPLCEAVHAAGGKLGYQLSTMNYNSTDLTYEDLKALQQEFIKAGKILKDVGFDAVEINAAGNNVGQTFLSRQRNTREDEYGPQSFENRARFVTEIIAGIKELCGADFPVQILMNAIEENDTNIGNSSLCTTIEENKEIAKLLEAAGADSLHLRLGTFGMHICQFASDLYFTGRGIEGSTAYGTQFDFARHWEGKLRGDHSGAGLLLDVAGEIKKAVSIPCGAVTYMDPTHAPDYFETALREGKVDFFLMNRPLTVDTQYVNKLREGRIDEIAPCTRCMHCHFDYDEEGKTFEHCRVNACTQRAFREGVMPEGYDLLPKNGDKKVMVIGGGPAGMEAARIAAQRGYDVTLYEKLGMLGGLLHFAAVVKGPHENLEDLCAYLEKQLELSGVKVVTGKEVDSEFIKAEAPDVVILAAGGLRDTLKLEATAGTQIVSLENAVFTELGDDVTVVGGNEQAVDMTLLLLEMGKHVTIVTPEPLAKLEKGHSAWVKQFITPMLYARGVRVWPNAEVKAINDGSITILSETGVDVEIPCSAVVEAMDMLPNTAITEGIGDIEVIAVGDARAPFNIAQAMNEGNLAARNI